MVSAVLAESAQGPGVGGGICFVLAVVVCFFGLGGGKKGGGNG